MASDLINYKGIYANAEEEQKYICPRTGAHFKFNDICKRLNKVLANRNQAEEQEKLKFHQKTIAQQKEITVGKSEEQPQIKVEMPPPRRRSNLHGQIKQ